MGDQQRGDEQGGGWDAGVETGWLAFRARLADAIATLAHDGVIVVELGHLADEEPREGAAPYVQFLCWGEGVVRAEAVSNAYLDPAFALGLDAYDEMVEIGWCAPTHVKEETPDHGSANFWLDVESREADRAAWMAVRALREVFGCVHPSFLTGRGWTEEHGGHVVDVPSEPVAEEESVVFATDRDDLHQRVVTALRGMLNEPEVRVDSDGDVPVRVGQSVLFVRVADKRPAIDLFAHIVVQPEDRTRLALELDILNRTHPLATFYLDGETVVMSHRLVAAPFVPAQLRVTLDLLVEGVDEIAATLAARVGGRRFLDPMPVEAPQVEDCPAMAGMCELMQAGRVSSSVVVELFEHDRREIVRMIVAVRTGARDCGELDEDDVLDHLRRGLQLVAREEARATRAASRLAAGGAAQQLSLLDTDTVGRTHRPRTTPRSA